MEQARLLLWRHGVTEWNAGGRFQGCNADVALSAEGLAQARATAPGVVAHRPDVIVSSPLVRARQTVEAVLALTGASATYDERLREIDVGAWCGLSRAEVLAADADYAAAFAEGRDYRFGVTGETRAELGARVGEALRGWARPGETVLVVSHGWAIQMGVASLLGWTYRQALDLRVMGNCALSVLANPDGRWRIETWNASPSPLPASSGLRDTA